MHQNISRSFYEVIVILFIGRPRFVVLENEMPLKSITIAFAVAVLAPIVGVAAFYGVHVLDSDAPEIGSAPTPDRFHFASSISEPTGSRSFAAGAELSVAPLGLKERRKVKSERNAAVPSDWLTRTYCSDGQLANGHEHCTQQSHAKSIETKAKFEAVAPPCKKADESPFAYGITHRMSLGRCSLGLNPGQERLN